MTGQPRLHHLLDRARRGVILPAEGEQLAGLVGELEAENTTLRDSLAHCRHKPRVTELEAEVARLTRALADADEDAIEAREHNDRTCEAVAERDRLDAEAARLAAVHEEEAVTLQDALGAVTGQCRALEAELAAARSAVDRVRALADRYQMWHDGGWAPSTAAGVAREYREALDQPQQPTTAGDIGVPAVNAGPTEPG